MVKKCLITLLGSCILAFGLCHIHSLSGVTEGGQLGLTLLLQHWLHITPALSALVINIICYVAGWKVLGKSFLFYSAIAAAGGTGGVDDLALAAALGTASPGSRSVGCGVCWFGLRIVRPGGRRSLWRRCPGHHIQPSVQDQNRIHLYDFRYYRAAAFFDLYPGAANRIFSADGAAFQQTGGHRPAFWRQT